MGDVYDGAEEIVTAKACHANGVERRKRKESERRRDALVAFSNAWKNGAPFFQGLEKIFPIFGKSFCLLIPAPVSCAFLFRLSLKSRKLIAHFGCGFAQYDRQREVVRLARQWTGVAVPKIQKMAEQIYAETENEENESANKF